ncbi:uncharacterized protein LOC144481834 [Mustelus asterias]
MIASNRNIFTGRKRKRVAQNHESTEQGSGNAAKSNPSKRHRDRLNVEFDNLLRLLPTTEEIAGRLDKLSVLRLSVSCLRLKRFFDATLGQRKRCLPLERPGTPGVGKRLPTLGNAMPSEGELLLQALNGFVLVVTAEGDIFYTSPTVQEYVGFHQVSTGGKDKEGIDHFQKRTVPFPLPFSTGEAVLYDHSAPVLGLAIPFPTESGSCSAERNGYVDPNSLFGIMMRQDKAVYISHPAVEPKYSLSRFAGGGFGGGAAGPQNGEKKEESGGLQEDDLLSILDDMLQSGGDEELNSLPDVLGSLGPEDLELMHWVESTLCVGPDAECPLSDALTNEQVLTYVQASLKTPEPGCASPCLSNSLQPPFDARDQWARCPDVRWGKGTAQRPSLPRQHNAPLPFPQQPSEADRLTQGGVPPCSPGYRTQEQYPFRQPRAREHQRPGLPKQQRMQWGHSLLPSGPTQPQCVQQEAVCKWRDAMRGPPLRPHFQQQPDKRLPGQQSYRYTRQASDAPSDAAASHGLCHTPSRAPHSYRVQSQRGLALSDPPFNAPNIPACAAPSQHSRLNFEPPGVARTSCGQGPRDPAGRFPGAGQAGAVAFPLSGSWAPHAGGKSTHLSVFHPPSTTPLSHLTECPRRRPEEQNGWRHMDLYKANEDPNGILGFHPTMNGTPIFGNGSAQ